MKTILKYFLWLFLLGTCAAQIEIPSGTVGGSSCSWTSPTNTCTMSPGSLLEVHAGDVLIVILTSNNANTNAVLAGTCNVNWPTPVRNVSGGITQMIWIVHPTTTTIGCNIPVTGLQGAGAIAIQSFRNVLAVGTQNISNTHLTGATIYTAPQITAAAPGHLILGLFSGSHNANITFTAVSPAAILRSAGTAVPLAMAATTATSAGQQITVQVTPSVTGSAYMRAAIELIPAPTNRPAHLNDAMQTILVNAPRNMDYELPSSGLSSTWCTWFMPINNAHTYELAPQSTQLNGQANHVIIPAWQMTRICQDAQGHFWASPPLLPGAGISITGSRTGVTIAATGGGGGGTGGMTWIAGGTSNFGGSTLPSHTCDIEWNNPEPGVLATDVVSYSLQAIANTATWATVHVVAVPSANTVTFWLCNATTANSVTPISRNFNWYILRHSVAPIAAQHKRKPARPTK